MHQGPREEILAALNEERGVQPTSFSVSGVDHFTLRIGMLEITNEFLFGMDVDYGANLTRETLRSAMIGTAIRNIDSVLDSLDEFVERRNNGGGEETGSFGP